MDRDKDPRGKGFLLGKASQVQRQKELDNRSFWGMGPFLGANERLKEHRKNKTKGGVVRGQEIIRAEEEGRKMVKMEERRARNRKDDRSALSLSRSLCSLFLSLSLSYIFRRICGM